MNTSSPARSNWLTGLWQAVRQPLAWGLLLSVVTLYLFIALAREVVENERLAFDTTVIGLVRSATGEGLTRLMLAITTLGDWRLLTLIGLMVGGLWWRRGRAGSALLLMSAGLGGALLDQALKLLFQRPRPDTVGWLMSVQGYSFPSGHAMMSLCFYGMLMYLLVAQRSWLAQFAGLVLGGLVVGAIGLSRIYLGVHYPSDVLGGFAAGLVWLYANILAYAQYRRRLLRRQMA